MILIKKIRILIYFQSLKKLLSIIKIIKKMNAINKYLPFGLKAQKIMPFFIIFKLLTFSGFIAYMMNR